VWRLRRRSEGRRLTHHSEIVGKRISGAMPTVAPEAGQLIIAVASDTRDIAAFDVASTVCITFMLRGVPPARWRNVFRVWEPGLRRVPSLVPIRPLFGHWLRFLLLALPQQASRRIIFGCTFIQAGMATIRPLALGLDISASETLPTTGIQTSVILLIVATTAPTQLSKKMLISLPVQLQLQPQAGVPTLGPHRLRRNALFARLDIQAIADQHTTPRCKQSAH